MKEALIILTPGFPSNENDTTTMYSQQLFVKILAEEFPEIAPIVISLHYPYTKKKYKWLGTEVIPLNGMRLPRWLRFLPWILAWQKLEKINRNYQIIGVLSFWCHEPALIGNWFSKRNKIRHLIWILGQDARKSNWLVKFIKPSSENLVSISDWITSEFEKNHHIRPSFYIPNGIDPADFSPTLGLKTIDIIGVGSLVALKQYTVFIDVVASLALSLPNLRVELCGTGRELALLKNKVDKMGLANMVTFRGELPHADVLLEMQKSKILLHPSSYEGYSTACLEALYAGCHVVSFTKAEDN
ncbi:MAG: glycosyltransferase, partial [Cyclobacteriaceae bacterium]